MDKPRHVSRVVAIGGVGALVTTLALGLAPGARADDITVTDIGPAVIGTAVNGAELVGEELFLVSRAAIPATLSTLDLGTRTTTDVETVPTGIEGWAATAVNDGSDLYFGMHTPADFYHYDIVGRQLDPTPVATFPDELLIMDQFAAPDDVIYIAGMARGASGGVYSFDPSTGESEELGQPVPGQRYVRSVAATADLVFAGMGPAASIQYRPRDGGDWTEITIPELEGESFVYDMAVEGEYLAFGTEAGGLLGVVDLTTMEATIVAVPDGRTIDSVAISDGVVYLTARFDGTLHAYDIEDQELTELATPSLGEEHRKLFVDDGRVIGVGGAGTVWTYDLASGEVDATTALESDLPRSPERVAQSIAVVEGDPYVAGHWHVDRHLVGESDRDGFGIPGEAKTMVGIEGRLYASIYPGAQVLVHDPATADLETLAVIHDNQMRPRTSHYNEATDSLLVGTREFYGNVGGAVSVIDPDTGAVRTTRDVVVDQAPISMASIGATAFIGHEIAGEVATPTTTEAHLVSWDIESGTTGWDVVPVPGAPAIVALEVAETEGATVLYGLTSNGHLFAVDPQTGEVIDTIRPGTTGTALASQGGKVYGIFQNQLRVISSHAPELAVEVVNAGSFSHLVADDTSQARMYAVGIRNVEGTSQARLFRIDLPAPDPVPTVTVTETVTAEPTSTPTVTVTAEPTATPTVTVTAEPTATPTVTVTQTVTATPRPTDDPLDKIPVDGLYVTPGFHNVNSRQWYTACEPYSQTLRCRTDIWSTQVNYSGGRFVSVTGWHFNNLTYLPYMTRGQWGSNPLANDGSFTSAERQWRTECDTATTGADACRSYVFVPNRAQAQRQSDGSYRYVLADTWVFNNMVLFRDE